MISLEIDIKSTFKYFNGEPILKNTNKEYLLEGSLHCYVKSYEKLYDIFNVMIVIPYNFPKQLPSVIEKDGKIPRTIEFHVDKEGNCCLGTKIALLEYMHKNKIMSFCQFLEQIIIMYFFQVKYFLVNGQWLEKPEAHYTQGVIDSYKRIFNITQIELKKIAANKFKRYSKCLCKSDRRFDKCHGKYISMEQIQIDLEEIRRKI
jgi:hypothetical protein